MNFVETIMSELDNIPVLPGFAPTKSTPIVPINGGSSGTVLPMPVTVGPTTPIGKGNSPIGAVTAPPASLGPLPANAGQGYGANPTGTATGTSSAITPGDLLNPYQLGQKLGQQAQSSATSGITGIVGQAETWVQWLAVNWVIGLVFLIAFFAFLTQTGAGKVVVQQVKDTAKDAATAAIVA